MTNPTRVTVACVLLAVASIAGAQTVQGKLAFQVSMERPGTHLLHIVLRCEGVEGATQEFKLPVWTPGYYRIVDFARHVVDFRAEDGAGQALPWAKVTKNTWRVTTAGAAVVVVSYDLFAFERSVADSFLDDSRAFISPASAFMHPAGGLRHPVTVTLRQPEGWSRISTGLDPVEGRPGTFFAPDFDVLYDCPILIGNQEILSFEVRGIPHRIALDGIGALDRDKFTADLKRIVEAAVGLIGDIPYRHYTFIALGKGFGGLEHANSTVLLFNDPTPKDASDYTRWLAFIAHEFFHLYNVKAIRPVALGPFDYDRENYTDLLWMSEGFTVYYEDRIMRHAGLLTPEQFLERAGKVIAGFENAPGHLHQSAAQASIDTWIRFFDRGEDTVNTTISYYDKGAALAMLLDLKIRHETGNVRSLDDVMRTLYRTFFQEKRRGFTDAELRAVCEQTAGVPLAEIFDVYATTVKELDYPRYFAYAGLAIDTAPKMEPGGYLGATTLDRDGRLTVASLEWGSPGWQAGLGVDDELLSLDGTRLTARTLEDALKLHTSGDRVKLLISRRQQVREIEVALGSKAERSFAITRITSPDSLQTMILRDWLQER
ncbi:MAG TPA: PDZ domain-containing protein [Thermoanaerobaculaceae bacterium]|nr:PDZ domain-containing protein [Thermoanaerobaculaceae bacterium]HPS77747.1 PDZ domain-containing protein [Thermoanaerobaculaceae bacterium]